jgi:hypothetical protein
MTEQIKDNLCPEMKREVWLLYLSSKKNIGLIPHDLNYFQTHFIGKPMGRRWKPPPVRITGKSKRLRDFAPWMHSVPVCSDKAKAYLEPIVGSDAEFLPLTRIKERPYYALNILRLMDCLDEEKSDIVFSSSEPKHILDIKTYSFVGDKLEDASIFRVPFPTSMVFVTRKFVDVVIANKLSGANFCDPSINCWNYVFGRTVANTVPGAID